MNPHILKLPHSPEGLPDALQAVAHSIQTIAASPASATPAQIWQTLAAVLKPQQGSSAITGILGSDRTPTLLWLLASQSLPQATVWHYSHASQQWQNLRELSTGETTRQVAPAPLPSPAQSQTQAVEVRQEIDSANATPSLISPPFLATSQQPPDVAVPTTAPRPGNSSANMTDGELAFKAFLYEAWGRQSPEYNQHLQRIEEEASARAPGVLALVQKSRRHGEKAYQLSQQLEKEIDQHGIEHARQWLQQQNAGLHEKIRDHLKRHLKKQEEKRQNWKNRQIDRSYRSTITPVNLVDGHHPNSLPHLPAASQWQIIIDETGSKFDESAETLNASDGQLGRVVAIAIPAYTKLPPLKNFHAVDEHSTRVDEVVQRLLGQRVGIFGFSVTDPSALHRYWIGHIQHLIRWTLLQLPVPAAPSAELQPVQIQVLIERNQTYKVDDTEALRALGETLESELQRANPAQLGKLSLRYSIIDKSHPLNGYADAIAFTWGSTAAESKNRLKKSRLLGHCLLSATEPALQRLYLSISDQRPLLPAEWYELCTAASNDPESGLLARALEQLGQSLPGQPGHPERWSAYLDEVRQRLRTKQYRLAELGHALGWLDCHAPAQQALPDTLRLQLQSTHLATQNHLGQIDRQRISDCLDLALKLRDEIPAEVCEIILRIATATTNVFEFDVLRGTITDWIEQPIAVPGLLNHGKLHSTLGQIEAFSVQPQQAIAHFDHAIAAFQRLSDPQQQKREITQTGIYRLIARLDANLQEVGNSHHEDASLLAELLELFHSAIGKKDPAAISRSLAHNGQQHRYLHHLWLRALLHLPAPLQDARQAYLQSEGQWQEGDDHPWPLIAAYRGWLLKDAGNRSAATEQLQNAIEAYTGEPHGPTLQWIAETLRTLAQALALPLPEQLPGMQQRRHFQTSLPQAPHAALANFAASAGSAQGNALPRLQILQHLNASLPFNFH